MDEKTTNLWNSHAVVEKPWGQYTDIYRSPSVVFKKIDIPPGEEISYQYHSSRQEFWYISSGQGFMTVEGSGVEVRAGDCFHIKTGKRHGIENSGNLQLTIFEIQCGDCREEDIVRLTDKYNRDEK